MTKEEEIMVFLHARVFDPVLNSSKASRSVKSGVNLTIVRMNQRDAKGMRDYFWNAIVGIEHSLRFADLMKEEGFDRFGEVLENFRKRFTDEWVEK